MAEPNSHSDEVFKIDAVTNVANVMTNTIIILVIIFI